MGRFKHHSLGIANSKALGWVTMKNIFFSLAELPGYAVVLFHEIKKQELLEEEKRQQNKRF